MSRVVFEHVLSFEEGHAQLVLPVTSRALSVEMENNEVHIWVDTPVENAPLVPYDFWAVVAGHGYTVPKAKRLAFLGNVVVVGDIVWHIFQLVDEPKVEFSEERARSVQHLLDLTYTMECQIIQLAKDKAHFERELAITRREHSEAYEKNVRLEVGLQALLGDDPINHAEALHRTVDIVGLHRLLHGGWRCDRCNGTGEIPEVEGVECGVCGGYGIAEATTADDYTEY